MIFNPAWTGGALLPQVSALIIEHRADAGVVGSRNTNRIRPFGEVPPLHNDPWRDGPRANVRFATR